MYNIPQSVHQRVQRISAMDESQYAAFLSTLEDEAVSYIKLSMTGNYDDLEEEQKTLLISFYVQYSMFSKLENDEVAADKLATLDRLIKAQNSKADSITSSNAVRKAVFR